jgi:hypothetical protein
MSLQKGKPVKFARPIGSMKTVYECIEKHQVITRADIIKETGLVSGKAQSAIWNLVYVGVIIKAVDHLGRTVYAIPGAWIQPTPINLHSINSIFNPNPLPIKTILARK